MTQRQFCHQKVHSSMSDDPRFPSQLVGSFTQEGSQLTSTPSNCFPQAQPARRELGTFQASWDLYILRASQAPKYLQEGDTPMQRKCYKSLHEGKKPTSPGA